MVCKYGGQLIKNTCRACISFVSGNVCGLEEKDECKWG